MALRSDRIAGFISDRKPDPGAEVQVLCEDHCGTYLLPFTCCWSSGAWTNAATGLTVEAIVVGWRERLGPAPSRPQWSHHLSSLKAPRRS